jgi:hypothetical protein
MRGLGPQVEGQTQQFKDQRGNLRNLINKYSNPYNVLGQGGWMGAAMGPMGPWEKAPLPNDPIVNQYQQNLMGGQKQSMMDLAKNLRQSNVRGMRVAGGANPYSQAVKDAYGSLASGYSDRYGQSMQYGMDRVAADNAQRQFLANLGMQGFGDATSALTNMLGLQKDYAFADEDRRRYDQNWANQMANQVRQQKIEDRQLYNAARDREQQEGLAERTRQLYNRWAGHGINDATQLGNYFMGPPTQMGSLGWSGLPTFMTG